MDVDRLVEHLATEGDRLAAAADRAGWDAPVPATEWTVRELVVHVGGVHRWAADIVTRRSPTAESAARRAVGSGPPDDELLEWYENGLAALVQTLRDAPPDLDCFTVLPASSARQGWARRQAHETAIHRADAEGAVGDVTLFPAALAQDGIDELLGGFARRRSYGGARPATIALAAADGPSRLITLGGERIESTLGAIPPDVDVVVRGLSSDLYLWLWNRPSEAIVDGDAELAALWSETVRITWR
jgi:uncharacterized protein (TIGR03083 family)